MLRAYNFIVLYFTAKVAEPMLRRDLELKTTVY